jgi:hypothetical protein
LEPISESFQVFDWIAFLFGGIGIVFLSMFWQLRYLILKPKITYPSEDESVQHQMVVTGTYSHLVKNQDIWIFVSPIKSGRYYPQRTPAVKDTNGVWRAIAYFGPNPHEEVGDPFMIYAVTANFQGTQAILNYINECIPTENWLGLSSIPAGCKERHSVHVIRSDA